MKTHVIILVIAIMACLTSLGCQQQNDSILSQEEVDLVNHQSDLAQERSLKAYAMTMAHEKEMNSTAPYRLRLDPNGRLFLIVDKPNTQVYLVDLDNNRLVLQ